MLSLTDHMNHHTQNHKDLPIITLAGLGHLGTALLRSCINRQDMDAHYNIITRSETLPAEFQSAEQQGIITHITDIDSHSADLRESDLFILAMRPADLPQAIEQYKPYIAKNTTIVPLIAGAQPEIFASHFGSGHPVILAMPNLPIQVGHGMTGLYKNSTVTQEHFNLVNTLMSGNSNKTVLVDRPEQLFSITAISGSGPAYVFYMLDCLQKAMQHKNHSSNEHQNVLSHALIAADILKKEPSEKVPALLNNLDMQKNDIATAYILEFAHMMKNCAKDNKFSSETSRLLAYQTVIGAIHYAAANQDISFATLRDKVITKGGTTEAAFKKIIPAPNTDSPFYAHISSFYVQDKPRLINPAMRGKNPVEAYLGMGIHAAEKRAKELSSALKEKIKAPTPSPAQA